MMTHRHAPHTRSRRRAGGYSIVEMALALAVLGLLLSSILLPLSVRYRNEQLKNTRILLAQAEEALIGYAMRNGTSPALAVIDHTTTPITRKSARALIPAGRPYLPCPDVTGDGLEDRRPLFGDVNGYENLDQSTSTAVVAQTIDLVSAVNTVAVAFESTRPAIDRTYQLSPSRMGNQLIAGGGYGSCASDKGWIPWASLGVPPHDHWGNRITYRVDPMFSNAALGFGSETRSDTVDPRMPLGVTTLSGTGIVLTTYARRQLATAVDVTFNAGTQGTGTHFEIDENPGLVCTGVVTTSGSVRGCNASDSITDDSLLVNGRVLDNTGFTLFDVYADVTIARRYEEGDVTNGMAFVLVSHGPNGYGAVNHLGQVGNDAQLQMYCNYLPGASSGYDAEFPENENADWEEDRCTNADGANLDHPSVSGTVGPRAHSFVTMPHHLNEFSGSEFDDVMRHMTGEQLIGELVTRGHHLGGAWVPPGPIR